MYVSIDGLLWKIKHKILSVIKSYLIYIIDFTAVESKFVTLVVNSCSLYIINS